MYKKKKKDRKIPKSSMIGPEMLRYWAEFYGWSLARIADYCGVSSTTIHSWVQGKTRPSLENFIKLATLTDGFITIKTYMTERDQKDLDFHFKTLEKRDIELI